MKIKTLTKSNKIVIENLMKEIERILGIKSNQTTVKKITSKGTMCIMKIREMNKIMEMMAEMHLQK